MQTLSPKYYLLLAANPLSDSVVALALYKIIRQLDVISGKEIEIFLPGFHEAKNEDTSSVIEKIKETNIANNEDYHGLNPIYHTYVPSHGELIFNDINFAQFMMDLEKKYPQFEYMGIPQLIIIPAISGIIKGEWVKSYNLTSLFGDKGHAESSLETFLLKVIKLLKHEIDYPNPNIIQDIDNLYASCISSNHTPNEEIQIKLDHDILKHMHWKGKDRIFFISYSTKDELDAETLKELLISKKQKVWMAPEGIPVGYDYACVIPAAVRLSSRFLVLLSRNSAESDWVRREIGQAVSKKKKLDGILLKDFSIQDVMKYDHLSFLLENIQLKYNLDDFLTNKSLLTNFIKR